MHSYSAFCIIRCINDLRYLSRDRTTDMVKRSYPKQNNLSMVHILFPGNWWVLKLFGIITIKAIKNIDREEKRYASCDS